jgi:hypothetical protein
MSPGVVGLEEDVPFDAAAALAERPGADERGIVAGDGFFFVFVRGGYGRLVGVAVVPREVLIGAAAAATGEGERQQKGQERGPEQSAQDGHGFSSSGQMAAQSRKLIQIQRRSR